MKPVITISDLQKTKCANLNPFLFEPAPKKQRGIPSKSDSAAKTKLIWDLTIWCKMKGLFMRRELQFNQYRKYSLDYSITDLELPKENYWEVLSRCKVKLSVEYQGGVFMAKSGHSNITGQTRDADKSNLAQSEGWKYITVNAINAKNIINELEKMVK